MAGSSIARSNGGAPRDIHPHIGSRVAAHQGLFELLAHVAEQAARDSRVELVRVRFFPDCSPEYDASQIIAFETVVRASRDRSRRDAYWESVEAALTCALPKLPKRERSFFEQNVSFEVVEE